MAAGQGARLLPGDEELPLSAALRLGLAHDGAVELGHTLGDVRVPLEEGGSGVLGLFEVVDLGREVLAVGFDAASVRFPVTSQVPRGLCYAEGVGFEPTGSLHSQGFSRASHSAALPSLQVQRGDPN